MTTTSPAAEIAWRCFWPEPRDFSTVMLAGWNSWPPPRATRRRTLKRYVGASTTQLPPGRLTDDE